jgi:uncharacterized protein (DUF697 family)
MKFVQSLLPIFGLATAAQAGYAYGWNQTTSISYTTVTVSTLTVSHAMFNSPSYNDALDFELLPTVPD